MPETKRPLKVFLCHSSADKPIVYEFYRQLNAEEWIDVWLDQEKLLPGQDWDLEIEKAVESADVVIVFLSKNSVTKEGYVQKELRFVLDIGLEKPEGTIFVIPLKLDDCEVPRRLRSWQYVDYSDILERKTSYARLIRSLRVRFEQQHYGKSEYPRPSLAKPPVFSRDDSTKIKRKLDEEKSLPTPEKESKVAPSDRIDVGRNVSGSVVVSGSNNVINMGTRTKGFLLSNMKDSEKGKTHVSEERVLEAAIERQVIVRKPASLFVWIRRQSSKNIISVVSAIDEKVLLDEDNVKAKGLEIEFPVENGETFSAGITLRLVAYEFIPSEQQKKIIVPPKGDSEVCTFIVTPKREGELLLSLEVLKDEVSLANRNLRTIAIDIEKKVDNSLLLVTIPIFVLVQKSTSPSERITTIQSEIIEAERQAHEKAEREIMERAKVERYMRESEERLMVEGERSRREEYYQTPSMSSRNIPVPKIESASTNRESRKQNKACSIYIVAPIVLFVLCIGLYLVLSYIYPWLQNLFK